MSVKSTRTRRMSPKRLVIVQDGLLAADVLEGYNPARQDYSPRRLNEMRSYLQKMQDKEEVARNAYEAARDAAIKAEWEASDFLIEVGNQVKAQYGDNSDEYASLGYKKKGAYKKASVKKG